MIPSPSPHSDDADLSSVSGEHDTDRLVLDLALAAAQIGVFDLDLVAGTRSWDERLRAIFGYTGADFDASFTAAVDERVHPDDAERAAAALAHAIDTCGTYAVEYRIVWPDGSTHWASARGRALCDEDGRTVRVLGAVSDTTAVREGAARTAALLESMAAGYLAMDGDWRITYVNAEGQRILGAADVELVGQVLWEVFPATVGTVYESNYRRAVDTGQVVTFDAFYPEPFNAWYEVRATPEHGGLALSFLDITARHDAQAARELAAQRLAALGSIALAMTDADAVEDLVAVVAEQGFTALGCSGGSIALPDPDEPDVMSSYITASYGEDTRAGYTRLRSDLPLPLCVAATTGQRALYPDRAACLALSDQMVDVMAVTGSAAFASIPMRAAGQLIGVLTAGWTDPQPFDDEQLELLETLAAQCAQALQRLAARDAERTAAAQQSALVAVAHAIVAAETEDDVLAAVSSRGLHLLGATGSGLCLRETEGDEAGGVRTLTAGDDPADVHPRIAHLPAGFSLPMVDTATGGTEHFLTDRAAALVAFPDAEALYTAADVQASASVPLRARGQLLGALVLTFHHPRAWSAAEQDLVRALAALTAQALDRIASRAAEQAASTAVARFSETLQRSLLTAPPEPDHLQIAVRYTPSAAEAHVGGDWYDAFMTGDGTTSLVIGDVTGHDSRAAAAMAQLRNLLRGIGHAVSDPPAAVLTALDRAVHDLAVDATATIVLAQVEQTADHRTAGTRLLRWSNAGHVPPLLVDPDGSARYLEADADLFIGLDPDTTRTDHEALLPPGATVLLFTDGLVERREAPLQAGLDWLASEVGNLAHLPLDELCDRLLTQVGDRVEDDVALLALRAHPEDGPRPPEAGPGSDPLHAPTPSRRDR